MPGDQQTTEADLWRDLDPLPNALADLCTMARGAWPVMEGWARNPGTPPDVAYSCHHAARLIHALEKELRQRLETAHAG